MKKPPTNNDIHRLKESSVKDILEYLGCPVKAVSLRSLNRLIHAYIRRVPWESVSRIVKRQTTLETADCPRWPEEFWHDAIQQGFGGTCFESSLAFFSLLTSLGYKGYLTVNDMGVSRGCHAAIVIILKRQKYLVDVTIPLRSAVLFTPHKTTKRRTSFQNYTIRPVGEAEYSVERSHHPRPIAFTLIDVPVQLSDYSAIVENDYTQAGLFLKSVVMAKVIEDKTWRFFSDLRPYKLERFDRQGKGEVYLSPETWTRSLAEKFHMPEDKISAAFLGIQNPMEPVYAVQMSSAFALEVRAQ